MLKPKISLLKTETFSSNKPTKTFRFFTSENNLNLKDNTYINKGLSQKIFNKSKIPKIRNNLVPKSKVISSSSSFNKKRTFINNKKENENTINIRKKMESKIKPKKNNIYIKIKNPNSSKRISNQSSYNKYKLSNIYINRTFSRNKRQIKNTPLMINKKKIKFNMLTNNHSRKDEEKKICKKDSSLNYLYRRYKNNYNKKKIININTLLHARKINNMTINYMNNSNKNINKVSINTNDFKKFNGDLIKKKLKLYKLKHYNKIPQNNTTCGDIQSSLQSTLRIQKKESFLSNRSENIDLEDNNKLKKNITKLNNNKNKDKKLKISNNEIKIINLIRNTKTSHVSKNNKNNIQNTSTLNQLINNYAKCFPNKYNFITLNSNKKTLISCKRKRNLNYNLGDLNKTQNIFKGHRNDIINITIDNTINNIVNINRNSFKNLNDYRTITTNNVNLNKKFIINDNKREKTSQNLKNKLKKFELRNNKNNKKINKSKENKTIDKDINKDHSLKNNTQSYRRKINKNTKFSSTKNLNYRNIIKKKINKLKETKSKNIINYNRKNKKNITIKENLKKIREKRKKKNTNLSIISINNMKLNSKLKLNGLKTIFSNFYDIDKKKLLLFNTPKAKNLSSFKNLNILYISNRFNKSNKSEKNMFLNKNIQENENNINENFFNKIKNNPQYSIEYIYEILQNLLIEENQYFEEINLCSFDKENNYEYCINPESWKFFINSLINIQELLYFNEHTLFLAILIFDKYISNILYKETDKNIVEENLDIVIVTSLIIASKKEEIKLYSMKDYLNLLPDKYSIKDLIKQENDILYKFKFNLLIPNSLDFFEIFSVLCKFDNLQKYKGLYLLHIILLDCNLLKIPPSLIAFCIIKMISKRDAKIDIFNHISNKYRYQNKIKEIKIMKILKNDNMIESICRYIQYIENNIKLSNYNSVIKKFNTIKFSFISSSFHI